MNKMDSIIPCIVFLLVLSILFSGCINSKDKGKDEDNMTLENPSIKINSKNKEIMIFWGEKDQNSFEFSQIYLKMDFNASILENEKMFSNIPSSLLGIDFCFDRFGNIHLVGIERFGGTSDYHASKDKQYSYIYYFKLDGDNKILVPPKQITNDKVLNVGLDIAVNSKNEILILYTSDRDNNFNIYFVKLNINGEVLIANKQLTKNQDVIDRFMQIDIDNNIHLTWKNDIDQKYYYIKINENSNHVINITELTNVTLNSDYPIISDNLGNLIYLRNDGVVDSNNFVHEFSINNIENNEKQSIIYSKLNSYGSKLIENETLVEYLDGRISDIDVKITNDNNIHVVWVYNNQIHYMKVDSNGTVLLPDKKIAQ